MSRIKDVKRKKQQKKRAQAKGRKALYRLLIIVLSLFLCGEILFAVKLYKGKNDEKAEADKQTELAESEEPKVDTSGVQVENLVISTESKKKNEPVSITVSSMGDCTIGTDRNFDQSRSLNAYYNSQGADYFFSKVRGILEADDLSIVNFEGTLTTSDQRADKTFAFKADPAYAAVLTSGSVEAANIANNHSKDYGSQSYTDTIDTLTNAGIAVFGYENVQLLEIKGVKVGLTGIYELAEGLGKKQQVIENITALKEAGAQIIIINFHWGTEKEYVPDAIQKELAHLAIDQGADLVIGHHPHVLQGIEKYNGKYIAYSLGNFCFGGNSNPSDKDTMIFQQTFTIEDGELLADDNINIIPCSLSSSSNRNDYCPRPLDGDEKQRVLDKIEKYSNQI